MVHLPTLPSPNIANLSPRKETLHLLQNSQPCCPPCPISDIESLILLDSGSDLPDVSVLHARYASMDAGDKSARLATLKKRFVRHSQCLSFWISGS